MFSSVSQYVVMIGELSHSGLPLILEGFLTVIILSYLNGFRLRCRQAL
jgi:hypothetical protein